MLIINNIKFLKNDTTCNIKINEKAQGQIDKRCVRSVHGKL